MVFTLDNLLNTDRDKFDILQFRIFGNNLFMRANEGVNDAISNFRMDESIRRLREEEEQKKSRLRKKIEHFWNKIIYPEKESK